jgi:hypothetical protein
MPPRQAFSPGIFFLSSKTAPYYTVWPCSQHHNGLPTSKVVNAYSRFYVPLLPNQRRSSLRRKRSTCAEIHTTRDPERLLGGHRRRKPGAGLHARNLFATEGSLRAGFRWLRRYDQLPKLVLSGADVRRQQMLHAKDLLSRRHELRAGFQRLRRKSTLRDLPRG